MVSISFLTDGPLSIMYKLSTSLVSSPLLLEMRV